MAASAPQHKLNSAWALWYCPNITNEIMAANKYKDRVVATKTETKVIDKIASVEEMWAVFNSLPPVMKLPVGDWIFYFRDGLEPLWEDPAFKKGGQLVLKLDLQPTADKLLATLLMAVLGESISCHIGEAEVVGGLRYTRREKLRDQFLKLEIWLTSHDMKEAVEKFVKEAAKDVGISNLDSTDNCTYTKF